MDRLKHCNPGNRFLRKRKQRLCSWGEENSVSQLSLSFEVCRVAIELLGTGQKHFISCSVGKAILVGKGGNVEKCLICWRNVSKWPSYTGEKHFGNKSTIVVTSSRLQKALVCQLVLEFSRKNSLKVDLDFTGRSPRRRRLCFSALAAERLTLLGYWNWLPQARGLP